MVGSRCVCSLSVGTLRLMSPPLRVGANIHFDTAYSQFPNTTFADHSAKIGGQVEAVLGPVAVYDQGAHPHHQYCSDLKASSREQVHDARPPGKL